MSELQLGLQRGLIGHWTMDDADTDGGTLYDATAHDNHMTLYNGVTPGSSGIIDTAYTFDGADDFLRHTFSSGDALDFVGDISYSFWIKHDSPLDVDSNNNYRILFNFDGQLSQGMVLEESSEITFSVEKGGTRLNTRSNSTLTLDSWQHVVGTHDTSTGDSQIYINGSLDATASYTSGDRDSVSSVEMGDNGRSPKGEMDDMRIYNRVLSADEVNALYQMRSSRTTKV